MYQTTSGQADTARLEDYIQAVRLRKWIVLGLAILGLVSSYAFATTRTSTYQATSRVALFPTPVGSTDNNKLVPPNLDKEKEILASNNVATAVAERVNSSEGAAQLLGSLDVKFTPSSDVLVASYTSTNKQQASRIVNEFVAVYQEQREASALGIYEDIIVSNTAQIEKASQNDIELRQKLTNAGPEEKTQLQSETSALQSQIRLLTTNLAKAEANKAALKQSPTARVLETATPPTTPTGVSGSIIMLGGLTLGLALGIVTAFLLERLDTTAKDENDVALALGSTVMGAIPVLGFRQRSGNASLVMLWDGGSARVAAAREAFRRLRSSLQFLNSSNDVNSIIVTSSAPGEGKSLTSANLSIALAQNGSRVVLVSADLRRPTLEKLLGMEAAKPGLAEYLSNTAELNAEKVTGIENLWLIRSGHPPGNPGELLNSNRFEQMIKELQRENVEYIVVDTPPVLSTADAVSAARYVDGVLVVVDTQTTETEDLLQVRADLERSGSKLLGAVMNRQRFNRPGLFRRDKYAYYRSDAKRAATAVSQR